MNIEQATIFITGCNRGLGAQLVQALMAKNPRKIYASSQTGLLTHEGTTPVQLDITKPEQVQAAAAYATDTTLLINNAGVNHVAPILNPQDENHARSEMEVNYFGTLAMCRGFAPILRTNGGMIVNIISILARVHAPTDGGLSASKAALLSMSHGLRALLAPHNVHVMTVLPGAMDTDMARLYHGPKTDPQIVAAAIVEAIEQEDEDVYPDDMARGLDAALNADRRAVEKQFAAYLPQ